MPIGPYADFENCVRAVAQRSDIQNPEAYCGALEQALNKTDRSKKLSRAEVATLCQKCADQMTKAGLTAITLGALMASVRKEQEEALYHGLRASAAGPEFLPVCRAAKLGELQGAEQEAFCTWLHHEGPGPWPTEKSVTVPMGDSALGLLLPWVRVQLAKGQMVRAQWAPEGAPELTRLVAGRYNLASVVAEARAGDARYLRLSTNRPQDGALVAKFDPSQTRDEQGQRSEGGAGGRSEAAVPGNSDSTDVHVPAPPKDRRGLKLVKAQAAQQKVTGIVLEPGVVDSQGDFESPEDIEAACHDFLARYRGGKAALGFNHDRALHDIEAVLLENYVAPVDFALEGEAVKQGSWLQTWHVTNPQLWERIVAGDITGFSIGGTGTREPADAGGR